MKPNLQILILIITVWSYLCCAQCAASLWCSRAVCRSHRIPAPCTHTTKYIRHFYWLKNKILLTLCPVSLQSCWTFIKYIVGGFSYSFWKIRAWFHTKIYKYRVWWLSPVTLLLTGKNIGIVLVNVIMVTRDSPTRFLNYSFFHSSNQPGQLSNGLKYFRFWLSFCWVLRIFVAKKLTPWGIIPREVKKMSCKIFLQKNKM